jgi:serine/threonine protein kinase
MSYCINPQCIAPNSNASNVDFCTNCGVRILLKERYRVRSLLGQGGFGKTFKAIDEDRSHKPLCVIKQFTYFNTDPQTQAIALELFYEEAKYLQSLGTHPQIPELIAYFDVKGQPYLVQEFIDGRDLRHELESNGIFNERQIRDLLLSLLPLLDFLHHQSIPVIHRDLKPANIIRRSSNGELVLVDFGAAKQATQTMLAKTGTVIGSAEYTAPEQIRGKTTFASDIFSLGVTCIHLLTQVSPFDLFDVHNDEWVWRDYLVNNPVDAHLGAVLDKMIINSLSRRYRSAADVLQELTHKSLVVTATPPAEITRLNKDLQYSYFNQALLYHEKLDFVQALANYTKAIELDPTYTYAYYSRAILKANELRDPAGALADYSKTIELNPRFASAYHGRAILEAEIFNNLIRALTDYNKAIELDPQCADVYYHRALLKQHKTKDRSGAIQDFRDAATLYKQEGRTTELNNVLKEIKDNSNGESWQL